MYQITEETIAGRQVIVLTDDQTDSVVQAVPEIGMNMIRCRLHGREIVEGPPGLSVLAVRSAEFGVPLLVPPSRIKGGVFKFQGRTYKFPINAGSHHLHGEVRRLPWTVRDTMDDMQSSSVTAEFRFTDFPDIMAYYPHPVVLRITYRLSEYGLEGAFSVLNEGHTAAPCGFGLHPYFSLGHERAHDVRMIVPAGWQYDTDDEGFIDREPKHTSLCFEMAWGMKLSDLPKDCDHFLFRLADGSRVCRLIYDRAGYSVDFKFDERFPYIVVFKPEWSDSVSLEPWSSITDAYNVPLAQEWTGAGTLHPGESLQYEWSWSVNNIY